MLTPNANAHIILKAARVRVRHALDEKKNHSCKWPTLMPDAKRDRALMKWLLHTALQR